MYFIYYADSPTTDSTGTPLRHYGVSRLSSALSADTTAVYKIDPPVAGMEKTLIWGSTTIGTMGSKIWVTSSDAGIQTSNGSSFTCISSSVGGSLKLMGVTTALWATQATTASGFSFTTTT